MGGNVSTNANIKNLGLNFSSDLSWYSRIEKVTTACKKDSHAKRLLSQYLDTNGKVAQVSAVI